MVLRQDEGFFHLPCKSVEVACAVLIHTHEVMALLHCPPRQRGISQATLVDSITTEIAPCEITSFVFSMLTKDDDIPCSVMSPKDNRYSVISAITISDDDFIHFNLEFDNITAEEDDDVDNDEEVDANIERLIKLVYQKNAKILAESDDDEFRVDRFGSIVGPKSPEMSSPISKPERKPSVTIHLTRASSEGTKMFDQVPGLPHRRPSKYDNEDLSSPPLLKE